MRDHKTEGFDVGLTVGLDVHGAKAFACMGRFGVAGDMKSDGDVRDILLRQGHLTACLMYGPAFAARLIRSQCHTASQIHLMAVLKEESGIRVRKSSTVELGRRRKTFTSSFPAALGRRGEVSSS